MMKKTAYILFVFLLTGAVSVFSAHAANTTVKAKLDSAVLLMGKQTALHLEIVQDKNSLGYFPNEKADTLSGKIEVAARMKPDTLDLDNNRIQINRDLIIQSFDSGMYVIPAIKYVIGKDTFQSNQLALKVIPVKVDSLKTVHDFKPVEEVPFHLFDWIPTFITDYWWIYLVVILLVGIGLFVYFMWIKKGKLPLMPHKKVLPPFEEAVQLLESLRQQQLWQAGLEKEYFTQLTDILRNYIDRRFLINAMEMTSGQILAVLKKNEESQLVNDQLSQILEMADFVKFAKVRPLPEDNEAAYQRAMNFVMQTKPVEAAEENGKLADDKKNVAAGEKQPKKKEGGK